MPSRQHAEIHGHRVSYLAGGEGPPVVLIHGVTGSCDQWGPVASLLAERYSVIAPDLLGHGQSAKPRGDYSLGAYASGIRDLIVGLGHERATVVGHSLGGGIAMQFAYQFPERIERLVLVSSGGLGRQVSPVLRAVALPGAELVLPLLVSKPLVTAGATLGRGLSRLGLRIGSGIAEMATGFASLQEAQSRRAFVHTARSVIDSGGQRVDATDKLYLAHDVPTLLVWGDRDPVIPARHGIRAHGNWPGSRLQIFEGAGHFPHHDDPLAFTELIRDFVATTEPSKPDDDRLRRLVVARSAAQNEPQ